MRPILVMALVAMPVLAHAHAHLVTSVPAADSAVAQVADLRIDYTEPVDPAKTTVTLADAAGHAVALDHPAIDPARDTTLVAHVPSPLPAGAYTVAWHAVAARNGHETHGTFGFRVDPAAAEAALPTVHAEGAWSRATSAHQAVGVAYVTLNSLADDRLLAASSPVAGEAQVHETAMDGAVMRMRHVEGVDLPAGQAVTLQPGGYHIMLMNLRTPLVVGQTFPLHLTFAHSPAADVQVMVQPVSATGPEHAHAGEAQ